MKKLLFFLIFFSLKSTTWLTAEWNPKLPFQNLDASDYGWEHLCEDRLIPVLFPNNFISLSIQKKMTAMTLISMSSVHPFTCYLDLKSLYLHLLTRHSRFPFSESIACKGDLVNRPIVNEYLEILWDCLLKMSPRLKRKPREFKINLSPILTDHNSSLMPNKALLAIVWHFMKNSYLWLKSMSLQVHSTSSRQLQNLESTQIILLKTMILKTYLFSLIKMVTKSDCTQVTIPSITLIKHAKNGCCSAIRVKD